MPVATATFSPKGNWGVLRSIGSFGGASGARISETGARFVDFVCPFSVELCGKSVVDCDDLRMCVFKCNFGDHIH